MKVLKNNTLIRLHPGRELLVWIPRLRSYSSTVDLLTSLGRTNRWNNFPPPFTLSQLFKPRSRWVNRLVASLLTRVKLTRQSACLVSVCFFLTRVVQPAAGKVKTKLPGIVCVHVGAVGVLSLRFKLRNNKSVKRGSAVIRDRGMNLTAAAAVLCVCPCSMLNETRCGFHSSFAHFSSLYYEAKQNTLTFNSFPPISHWLGSNRGVTLLICPLNTGGWWDNVWERMRFHSDRIIIIIIAHVPFSGFYFEANHHLRGGRRSQAAAGLVSCSSTATELGPCVWKISLFPLVVIQSNPRMRRCFCVFYCQGAEPHCLLALPRVRMCLLLKELGVACSSVSRTVFKSACSLPFSQPAGVRCPVLTAAQCTDNTHTSATGKHWSCSSLAWREEHKGQMPVVLMGGLAGALFCFGRMHTVVWNGITSWLFFFSLDLFLWFIPIRFVKHLG